MPSASNSSFLISLKVLRILCRLTFLTYYIISLSYRLCFLENLDVFGEQRIAFLFWDYIADAFFIADFILLLYHEGVNAPSTVGVDFEPEQSKIAAHHLAPQISLNLLHIKKIDWWPKFLLYGEIFLHLMMIFPFEVVGYAAGFRLYAWLRVVKALRLLYFPFYWKQFTGLLGAYRIVQSAGLHRIVLIMYIMGICGHFSACAFYAIALDDMRRRGNDNTWLVADGLASFGDDGEVLLHRPLSYRFLRASYWSFQTIASVAFGDIAAFSEPETWYCIFYFYVVGLCVYFSIANLIMVITNFDEARNDNLRKIAKFNKYATYRRLPPELNNRVRSYYSYQWQLLKGVDENEILSELPSNIAQQVLHLMVRDLLIEVDALKDLNKAFLNALSERAESYIFSPSDVIVDFESKVVGVYIISAGEIERIRHEMSLRAETLINNHHHHDIQSIAFSLHSGQYFGSSALFKSYMSKHQYKELSFAEVLLIRGSVYRYLCKLYLNKEQLKLMNETIEELTFTANNEEKSGKLKLKKNQQNNNKTSNKQRLSTHFNNAMNPFPYFEAAIAKSDRDWKNNIFSPESYFRILWDVWLFCCLIFYLITCGLLFGAMLRTNYFQHYYPMLISCYIIDVFFIIELIFRASLFGYHNEGIIVTKSKLILQKFLLNPYEIILQLLSVVPLDLILGFTINIQLIPLLRLLKLIHVRKLIYYLQNFEDFLRIFCKIVLSFEMARFLHLYLCLFFMCHWGASIWSLTSTISLKIFKYQSSWRINDTSGDFFHINYSSLNGTAFYIRSIYWAINVFACIGFADMLADNILEMIIIIIIMFFGYLIFNTLLGAIATLMNNFNKEKREFNTKVEKIKQLMHYKAVPIEVEVQLQRYYEYIWTRYNGVNEVEVLNTLPKSLRAAVLRFVIGPLLKNIPFFKIISEPMEQTLVNLFHSRIFLDNDPLMLYGELGREMFIIEKGLVKVTSVDQKLTFATLKDGDYIGESSLLDLTKRTASVYAIKYVDTYYLTCEDFLKAAEKFPSEYGLIIDSIHKILQEKLQFNATTAATAATINTENDDEYQHIIKNIKNVHEVSIKKIEKYSMMNNFLNISSLKINPDSNFRIFWDILIFFILFYNAIIIPLRIALNISPFIFILDYFGDFLNILDSYFYYTIFTLYNSGRLLIKNSEIQQNYIKNRLIIDLFTEFPYEIFLIIFFNYEKKIFFLIWACLRIPKLIKCLLLRQYLKQLEHVTSKILNINYIIFRFLDLTCSILLISHFVACTFYCFAEYGKRQDDCTNHVDVEDDDVDVEVDVLGERTYACEYRATWVEMVVFYRKLPPDGGTQWQRLIRAYDWTIPTLTAETMGDVWVMNQNECLFAFLIIFFGLTVNAMIIGSIINLVTDVSEETTIIYRRIELLSSYLEKENVPQDLILSSTRLLRHQASTEGSLIMGQERMIAELPLSIQSIINDHIKTTPFLKRCPIFDLCPDEILRNIASRLQQIMYIRHDQIITYGELGSEMFFLENGIVNVVSEDQKTLYSTLEDGAFFGETALFFHSTRTATILVASPFCICYVLSKNDLDNELKSSDIEEDLLIKTFKTLQLTNKKRNDAVQENLSLALNPNHKLYRMIHQNPSKVKKTLSYYLTLIRITLSPESYYRVLWDSIGLIFLIYYTFSIPFGISYIFGDQNIQNYMKYFLSLDILIIFYWIFDVICKLFFFSYKEDMFHDRIITDSDSIFHNYYKNGFFYYDIIGSIPFELLVFIPNLHQMTYFITRITHLIKFPQLLNYSNVVEYHLQKKLNINFQRSIILLFKAGFVYITLNHWMACGYFMIHRYNERTYDWTYVIADKQATYDTKSGEHNICDVGVSYCYARSIYLVVTIMAGIGYGDIGPHRSQEFIYQMMVAIIGAYIAATVLGFCGMFLEDRDANGITSFKKKIQAVETYINFRRLESPERDALLAQYTYIWNKLRSTISNRNQILDQLSPSIAMEISIHLQSEILKKVFILDCISYRIKRRVAYALRPQIALADSHMYRAGDVGYSIFFVSTGKIQISLSSDLHAFDACGMSSLTMLVHKQEFHGLEYEAGTHFGEYCVLSKSGLRPDNATVLTTAEVYALSKEDLWGIFLYMTYNERREFLCDLFTRVGRKRHLNYQPKKEEEIGVGDERLKMLFRTANRLLSELIGVLNQELNGSDSDSDDGDMNPSEAALKALVKQESKASNTLSQRDIMYLLDEIRPTGSRPSGVTGNFPRRINRQVSIPDDIPSVLRHRRVQSRRGSINSVPESEVGDNEDDVEYQLDDVEAEEGNEGRAEFTVDIDGNIATNVQSNASVGSAGKLKQRAHSFSPRRNSRERSGSSSISPDIWDKQSSGGFARSFVDSPKLRSQQRDRRYALQVINGKCKRSIAPEESIKEEVTPPVLDTVALPKVSIKAGTLPPLDKKMTPGLDANVSLRVESIESFAAFSTKKNGINIFGEEKVDSSTGTIGGNDPMISSFKKDHSRPRRHSLGSLSSSREAGVGSSRKVSFIPDDNMDATGRSRKAYHPTTAQESIDEEDADEGAFAMPKAGGEDLNILRNAMEIEERILGIKRPRSVVLKRRDASIQLRSPNK